MGIEPTLLAERDFEADEAADARTLGETLLAASDGGPKVQAARNAIKAALDATAGVREARVAIHGAIDQLVQACGTDGTSAFRAALGPLIIAHQMPRTMKDRDWFKIMGFDAGM